MEATEERNPEVLEYRVLWLGWYRRYRRGRWARGSAIECGTKKPELAAEGGWLACYGDEEGFLSAPGGARGKEHTPGGRNRVVALPGRMPGERLHGVRSRGLR